MINSFTCRNASTLLMGEDHCHCCILVVPSRIRLWRANLITQLGPQRGTIRICSEAEVECAEPIAVNYYKVTSGFTAYKNYKTLMAIRETPRMVLCTVERVAITVILLTKTIRSSRTSYAVIKMAIEVIERSGDNCTVCLHVLPTYSGKLTR